jgi:hypothetical protein
MTYNPAAANVLGTLGAVSLPPDKFEWHWPQVCWSIQVIPPPKEIVDWQLIPQIIINYRRHNATGLQPTMMFLWACAGVPLGVYNIVENFNIALRIQPQILTVLSLITFSQCVYYEKAFPVASPAEIDRNIPCSNVSPSFYPLLQLWLASKLPPFLVFEYADKTIIWFN